MRRTFDRFQPENFDSNVRRLTGIVPKLTPPQLKIVDEITALAKQKGVTNAQLVLAWLISVPGVVVIPGSTRAEGVTESLGAYDVKLSEADIAALRKVMDNANVIGGRCTPERFLALLICVDNAQMAPGLEG